MWSGRKESTQIDVRIDNMTLTEIYRTNGLSGIRERVKGNSRAPAMAAEYENWLSEIMTVIHANLEAIAANLIACDYRFGDLPEEADYWGHLPRFSGTTSPDLIDAATKLLEGLPNSIQAFYRYVGGVSFLGNHPDWPAPEILDAFSFEALNDEYLDFLSEELTAYRESDAEDRPSHFPFPFAPDRFHKANISGGAPYSVLCNPDDLEGEVVFIEETSLAFFDYLNRVFRWGGFPGLEHASDDERAMLPLGELNRGVRLL